MDNKLFITDEDGNELEMEILFTFEDETTKKKYVLFEGEDKESGDVFASCYDDEGNLFPVETDAEWSMIEEVLGSFEADEE